MAIAGFLDRMCLALWASGLWLRYAAKFDPFLSLDCALHPGAIQGESGIKYCHLATLTLAPSLADFFLRLLCSPPPAAAPRTKQNCSRLHDQTPRIAYVRVGSSIT